MKYQIHQLSDHEWIVTNLRTIYRCKSEVMAKRVARAKNRNS